MNYFATNIPPQQSSTEHRTRAELRVVLTISGVKIGIETEGENIKRINDSLDLFVKLGCEIIICAARTTGKTVIAVEQLPEYEVLWRCLIQSNDYLATLRLRDTLWKRLKR